MKVSRLLCTVVTFGCAISIARASCYVQIVRPCPPATSCSTTGCPDDNPNNIPPECPGNATEYNPGDSAIPDLTGADKGWENFKEWTGSCGPIKECGSPCILGTASGKFFCAGPGAALAEFSVDGHQVLGPACNDTYY